MQSTGGRLLIVDDEEGIRDTFKESLEASGYVCHTASGGQEALETLATETVDLAILDIMMPGMSGMTLFQRMKEGHPDVTVIFITAMDRHQTVVDNLKGGASDYLVKPVPMQRLRRAVEEALDKRNFLLKQKEQYRLLEQQIAYHARQMEPQELLRVLGQMAGGVAHDFNNALAQILGFTELLLEQPEYWDGNEEVTHYLELVRTSAEDATNVIGRLRQFYRRDGSGEFKPVNLNQVVGEVIELTQPKWGHKALAEGCTIHIEKDLGEVPEVVGSAADLRAALTNLIFNAVDATLQKTDRASTETLTLRTYAEGEGPRSDSFSDKEEPPTQVVLEVADSGTGMSDEIREHCLEPFISTKGGEGSGLGLSEVHNIVRRHGGTLTVESELGKGTTISIRVPTAPFGTRESGPITVHGPVQRPLHILVVEDEPKVREVLTKCLATDGHTVDTAPDGRKGLEIFEAGKFDLVLADCAMPGMSGGQLATAIKGIEPEQPIILLSGSGDLTEASAGNTAEVDLIVRKPVSLATLRDAVAVTVPKG